MRMYILVKNDLSVRIFRSNTISVFFFVMFVIRYKNMISTSLISWAATKNMNFIFVSTPEDRPGEFILINSSLSTTFRNRILKFQSVFQVLFASDSHHSLCNVVQIRPLPKKFINIYCYVSIIHILKQFNLSFKFCRLCKLSTSRDCCLIILEASGFYLNNDENNNNYAKAGGGHPGSQVKVTRS